MTLIEQPEFRARMHELRALSAGWLDGKGQTIDERILTHATEWIETVCAIGVPLPRAYPTLEGGLEVEWQFGRLDIMIAIDPYGTFEFHAMHLDTGELDERNHGQDDTAALVAVAKRVQELWTASGLQS